MSTPFFTPVGDCYLLATTVTSANLTMTGQTVSASTALKVDNAGPNIAYIKFSTTAIGNINHPTAGTGNATAVISLLPSTTTYISPNLGTYTGNIVVTGINAAGTSSVLITVGAAQ